MKHLKHFNENKEDIFITRRSPDERRVNHIIAINKKVKLYIKNGGVGDLDLSNTPVTSLPDDLKVGGGIYKDF